MIPKRANVVVIGGGVLGTSAAFHLADAGEKDVLLLDRGPIASGTTPFAAGQTGYLKSDATALDFGVYCLEFLEEFEKRTGRAIDFRQDGSLLIALTEKHAADLEARVAAAKTIGHEAELISPERARQLVPSLQLNEAAGILQIPRDGYVEPKSLAVAYAAAATDRGASIQTRTPVTEVEVVDGRVRAVVTPSGRIETDWVVLAAGAWTRQFGQRLGLDVKAVPVRHQAFVTGPMKNMAKHQPITRVVEPQIYIRPYDDGLLVGGYGYRPLSFDMNDFPHDFEIPALEADQVYYHQLAEAASQFFPALRDATVIQERRGLPTMSADGDHIVSELVEAQGMIVAGACNVGGIHSSPGVGRVVADIVTGREPWLPAASLKADRFGDDLGNDAILRSRCEEVYARHYHRVL